MLQGYENLTSVKLDFVLFEARVGDALEKLVELGAGAEPDEASVSRARGGEGRHVSIEGKGGALHDEKEKLFGSEGTETAHDVGVFHESEDLALRAATRLFAAANHVFLQQLFQRTLRA